MRPSLPQHDPLAPARRVELELARREYVYDYSYEDILYAESVPLRDKSDVAYWLGLGRFSAEIAVNEAMATTTEEKVAALRASLEEKLGALDAAGWGEFTRATRAQSDDTDTSYPVSGVEDFDRAYRILRSPLMLELWDRDDVFAWQALAGANPTMVRRLAEPLETLALTEELYQRVVGAHDTLAAAMAEGRLLVADYAVLEGLTPGVTDDHPKHLWAPIAVYVWQRAAEGREAGLLPVCIQVGQSPGESPMFTPADGTSWKMARLVVRVGDSQVQGLMVHFGLCHLVMEAITLAMKRQLATRHPLRALITPHVENTLIANEICRSSLTNPGGIVDRLQAPVLPEAMGLCVKAVADFRLMASSPAEDCAARGVGDVDALPVYPHRDDQLAVWDALEPFVDAYVRLYYTRDEDVAGDAELQAFVAELGAEEGGRLQGIGDILTVDRLVALMARIVFRASAFHASINYALYDFSYAGSGPTSAFGRGPRGGAEDDDLAFREMLAPWDIAYEVVSIYYTLQLRLNRLGDYGDAFSDPAVAPLVEALQERLAAVDALVDERNTRRLLPYVFSRPEQITASIHV
ncbi:MAG: hypothetical protein H6732_03950 [Alphaproteobacteria bacterium]|nr:hypothetical protein [Alphaproteobacteria bacterium]